MYPTLRKKKISEIFGREALRNFSFVKSLSQKYAKLPNPRARLSPSPSNAEPMGGCCRRRRPSVVVHRLLLPLLRGCDVGPPPLTLRFLLTAMMMMMLLWCGVVVVQGAETAAQRQALFDFYGATSNGAGWKSSCSGGGWRTMGGSPPPAFCNSVAGRYSSK
jgi:hypothetical protein